VIHGINTELNKFSSNSQYTINRFVDSQMSSLIAFLVKMQNNKQKNHILNDSVPAQVQQLQRFTVEVAVTI
jgi:hypothetical protein